MIRVLFVCLGNICRSPMAEAIFAHKVREAGLSEMISADSAGTADFHTGSPPHRGTIAELERHGISWDHRARPIRQQDTTEFDYVLAMDELNLADLNGIKPRWAVLSKMMEYASNKGCQDVPDPYYTGEFDLVYDLLDAATAGLLREIREAHGL